MLDRLPIDSFDWLRWRNCDIFEKYHFACREYDILKMRNTIKELAIGYADGKDLFCRNKPDCMAVMFLIDGVFSWCHLTKKEFSIIFG